MNLSVKKALLRAGTSVMALLCTFSITATILTNQNAATVHKYFGTTATQIVSDGDGNTTYFASDYSTWQEQLEHAIQVGIKIQEEGSVLLENNGALPLNPSAKLSVFSRSSVDIVYSGTGSGRIDASVASTLKQAFERYGFSINPTLWDFYSAQSGYVRTLSDVAEVPVSVYTAAVEASYADYSDAAIVVLSRGCGEGGDLSVADGYLELQGSERDLLEYVTGKFDKVIVLINSGNAIAMDWVDEYDVDAILWIGLPGQEGLQGVAQLLNGTAAPSGKLADVYSTSSFSAPAMQNFGEYVYGNVTVNDYTMDFDHNFNVLGSDGTDYNIWGAASYVVEAEGIYVGYKYYETRYEDAVLKQGNASGSAGVYNSSGTWNYSDEVAYSFGYGLSYTTFTQTLDSFQCDGETATLAVTVTNTGSTYSGKEVVQVYAQAPYIQGGVEKASVQLCGFDKTDVLAPGQSQTLTITVDLDDIASYDYQNKRTYILDAGTYYFAIGNGAHDALNNILAAKGKTVENDMDYDGNAALAASVNLDASVRGTDDFSGLTVTNLFEEADLNYYQDGTVTYLSRSNWQGTWPVTYAGIELNDRMILDMLNDYSTKETDVTSITYGEDNGLTLVALREADFNDPAWDALLDQMTLAEQVELVKSGASQTAAVESIAFAGTVDEDGPAGLSKRCYYDDPADVGTITTTNAYGYNSSVVIASTFNVELAYERGVSVGEDGLWTSVQGWWGPGCNAHRTPYGGRNFEYYSEDAYLGGVIAANDVAGAQSKGLRAFIKHFAMNDQETNRHGVSTFANEQAMREIYLKQFQYVIQEGGSLSVMEAYNRIGVKWAGSSGICDQLLRDEWGFNGSVLTDFNIHNDEGWMNVRSGLGHGVDQWLSFGECSLEEYARKNIGLAAEVREASHNILYAVSRSAAMNGMNESSRIEFISAWWQTGLYAMDVVFGILTAACFIGVVIISRKKNNKVNN